MVRATFLGIASTVTLLAVASQLPKIDTSVDRVFDEGHGLRIEGIGVCVLAADKIACWDMEGAADPTLTRQVTSYFSTGTSDVVLRFGRKNRWLVIRKTGDTTVTYQSPESNYSSQLQVRGDDGKFFDLVRSVTPREQADAAVVATIYGVPGPPPATIIFKEGAKTVYEGRELEIGPWKPMKPEDLISMGYGPPAPSKQWSVVVGIDWGREPAGAALTFQALSKDGKAIRFVDKNGEPVSEIRLLSEGHTDGGPWMNRGKSRPRYQQAFFSQGGPSNQGAMTLLTSINPARIGSLQVSETRQRRVLIKGFPLDPRER